MMTIQDFQFASFEKKCDVVACQSSYLCSRQLGDCKVYLYHTGEFFIEVYYSVTHKKVLMISGFTTITGLDPYTEMISLMDLAL